MSFIDKALERAKESQRRDKGAAENIPESNARSAEAVAGSWKFGWGGNSIRRWLLTVPKICR